jgi:hypothetical protein
VSAARRVAQALAAGRAVVGVGLVVAPETVSRLWLGRDGRRPATKVFARGLGMRDAVLGGLTLHTLEHPQVGPRWVATLALVDATDLAATLAARGGLPARATASALALAGGAAVAEAWAARALRAAQPAG